MSFTGELQGLDAGSFITITLNANTGDIILGGNGQAGTIILKDEEGSEIARLGRISGAKTTPSVALHLKEAGGQVRVSLNSSTGKGVLGGNGVDGELSIKNQENDVSIRLDGEHAHIVAGGGGRIGSLQLNNAQGKTRFYLGSTGSLRVGGNGGDGDIYVLPGGAADDLTLATIHLDGDSGRMSMKAGGVERVRLDAQGGRIVLRNNGQARVVIDADDASVSLGGNGTHGELRLFKDGADTSDSTKASIHLDGNQGDILLRNADCAEEFDLTDAESVDPGTVMVLTADGTLDRSRQAYDLKVVGIVSGAGGYKPGIILDSQRSNKRRVPIALAGKTWCKVDAAYGSIEIGDLLTSSSTEGHAMKAVDPTRASGAVIGKALKECRTGCRLIPVLVALR